MPRNIAGSKLGNGVISLLSWIIPISLIVTPIMANFHLYPIQLWWQFFQIFRMAMWFMPKLGRCWCWPWKTVSSHLNTPVQPMFLHRMAVFSFWLFRKNLCDSVARIFWANANQFTPPPPPGNKLPVRLCSHFASLRALISSPVRLLLETPAVRPWRGCGCVLDWRRWRFDRFDCITFRFQGFKPHNQTRLFRTFTFYGFVHFRHLFVHSAGYWQRKKIQQSS